MKELWNLYLYGIYTKYPILNKYEKYIQNPSNSEDYSKEGRIYLETEIKIKDKILTVGTAHLSYTHKFEETELKDKEIDNLIEILKYKKENYIFCGDLNTNKESSYIKKIEQYLINYDTTNTWTTKPFSYNGFIENSLNWKLDYVFSTQDVVIKDIQVLDTEYSDHLPILVSVEI